MGTRSQPPLSPKGAGDASAGAQHCALPLDQRTSDRLPIALPLTYQFEGPSAGKSLHGRSATTDLSGRGVQFLIPWHVEPAARCQIALDLPYAVTQVSFLGTVSWCRTVGETESRFEVGVAIEPADGQEEAFASYCHFVASQLLVRALAPEEQP